MVAWRTDGNSRNTQNARRSINLLLGDRMIVRFALRRVPIYTRALRSTPMFMVLETYWSGMCFSGALSILVLDETYSLRTDGQKHLGSTTQNYPWSTSALMCYKCTGLLGTIRVLVLLGYYIQVPGLHISKMVLEMYGVARGLQVLVSLGTR